MECDEEMMDAAAENAPVYDRKRENIRARSREYARRKRKELYLVREKMLDLYNELVRLGAYGKLSDDSKEFFSVYVHREEAARKRFPPTLYRMFGNDIAPGVRCSLREAMQRLYKGKNEINFMVRRWEEKSGIAIEFFPDDSGSALDGVYVIMSVPEPKERERVDDVREIMSDREKRWFRDYESRK